MPLPVNSCAKPRVNGTIPALETQYGSWSFFPSRAPDVKFTMRPQPRSTMCTTAARLA